MIYYWVLCFFRLHMTGVAIHGSMKKFLAYKFKEKLHEKSMYIFKNFTILLNKKTCPIVDTHQFIIHITHTTQIYDMNHEPCDFALYKFQFVAFNINLAHALTKKNSS